ncbi:hypothetical protein [Stieleria tagensis]|uniref:hypothetical protein n=1 Tax=Stieleria tagensis TaxID=2956795 RepID=UPI00209A8B94|nr:hypothetical protein [Stieleria tagensis]
MTTPLDCRNPLLGKDLPRLRGLRAGAKHRFYYVFDTIRGPVDPRAGGADVGLCGPGPRSDCLVDSTLRCDNIVGQTPKGPMIRVSFNPWTDSIVTLGEVIIAQFLHPV